MQIIPICFCCCCCFSSSHATSFACACWQKFRSSLYSTSHKSRHVNVRKMLWDHPTKRWKNPTSLSKFPLPPAFLKKKIRSKNSPHIWSQSARHAILNKILFAEVLSTATDTQEKRTRGKNRTNRLLLRCSSLLKLHDGS